MNMKKTWMLTCLTILFLMTVAPFSGICGDKVYKIGMATIATHPALDATRQGFIDEMAEHGFVDGKNVIYEKDNAEGDMSLATTICKKYVSQKKDMIVATTTPIVQACFAAAKRTNINIVFNAVTDPAAAKVVESWEKPGGNVTGASDWMDVGAQVGLMIEIVPSIKSVGVIYNTAEVNSRVQVAELEKAAPGLGIKVVKVGVSSTADVLMTAKSLVGRVDSFWFPTDNIVVAALEAVVKVGEDNNIPIFGSDPAHPKRGVIAASGVSMYDVGRSSGKMAAAILNGADPGSIAVTKGVMSKMTINLKAASRMGVIVPQSVIDKATEVIR
jgi:putative ABC transport system substrate-binding protein